MKSSNLYPSISDFPGPGLKCVLPCLAPICTFSWPPCPQTPWPAYSLLVLIPYAVLYEVPEPQTSPMSPSGNHEGQQSLVFLKQYTTHSTVPAKRDARHRGKGSGQAILVDEVFQVTSWVPCQGLFYSHGCLNGTAQPPSAVSLSSSLSS